MGVKVGLVLVLGANLKLREENFIGNLVSVKLFLLNGSIIAAIETIFSAGVERWSLGEPEGRL